MKVWNNLKKVFEKINHGTIKVIVENGQPVSVSSQAIVSGKGDRAKVKLIKRTIDLTE